LSQDASARPGQLILVPAVITLAVTLLRLVGELLGWAPFLFSRAAGGGGALVGIVWLVPVFGAWFGWKLTVAGDRSAGLWRALGVTLLALAVLPVAGFVAGRMGVPQTSLRMLFVFAVASVVAVAIGLRAWSGLGKTLLAYGFAARVPVVVVMLVAMLANWGTHYDVVPPGVPEMGPIPKWLVFGVVPQLTIWVAFTLIVGSLFGIAAAAIARRRPASA
jgi:hypothetical protein